MPAIAVVILLLAIVVGGALNAIFRVALFQFATRGEVPGGFEAGELQAAFAPSGAAGCSSAAERARRPAGGYPRPPVPPPDFDLQAHSTCSDGEWPPADVVAGAANAGVRLLALTDHDTVDGVDAALSAAAGQDIEVVPAVELSALTGADGADVHVLGYRLDHRDPTLRGRLEAFRADRELRSQRMAQRLVELGLELDRSELDRRRAAGEPIGRPHLAAAVLNHPGNGDRLAAEGTAGPSEFFEAYLVPGAPAFVGRSAPTVPEAIAAIHDAGGVAVWAHPFWDVTGDEEALATLERFVAAGLDGVEVFYPTHTESQVALLAQRGGELGLLQTGSTDFHGPGHALFDGFLRFELFGHEPVLGPIAEPAGAR